MLVVGLVGEESLPWIVEARDRYLTDSELSDDHDLDDDNFQNQDQHEDACTKRRCQIAYARRLVGGRRAVNASEIIIFRQTLLL